MKDNNKAKLWCDVYTAFLASEGGTASAAAIASAAVEEYDRRFGSEPNVERPAWMVAPRKFTEGGQYWVRDADGECYVWSMEPGETLDPGDNITHIAGPLPEPTDQC